MYTCTCYACIVGSAKQSIAFKLSPFPFENVLLNYFIMLFCIVCMYNYFLFGNKLLNEYNYNVLLYMTKFVNALGHRSSCDSAIVSVSQTSYLT